MEIRISVRSICRLFYACILCWNEVSKPLFFLEGMEADVARNLVKINEDANPSIQSPPVIDEKAVGNCQLIYSIIEVPKSDDPFLFTYPKCVKVKKCQGCCISEQMSCQPKSTRIKKFPIHRFRYTKTQTEIVNIDDFNVEEHLSCNCDCKKKPEDCSVNQVYERNICDCTCKNAAEARRCTDRSKFWDKTTCQCICRDFKLCPGSYEFDPVKCRCKYKVKDVYS